MAKKTAFFHIGEPKCASTHLQYAFELLRNELLHGGVVYPFEGNHLEFIGSGNIVNGEITEGRLHRRLKEASQDFPDHNLLFSSEWLFSFLVKDLHTLLKICESEGYRLHILWVLRDTEPLISSQLMQTLKRHSALFASA